MTDKVMDTFDKYCARWRPDYDGQIYTFIGFINDSGLADKFKEYLDKKTKENEEEHDGSNHQEGT